MRKHFQPTILAALLAVMSLTAVAAPVGIDQAQATASVLLKQRAQGRAAASAVTMNLAYAQPSTAVTGLVDYYVFNASDGASFAIVAGDDRARAVLAWGDGTLDMADLPCGMECMLEQYREQMDWLAAHSGAVVEAAPAQDALEGAVMPLLTCSWSQSEPYYNLCPTNAAGEHAVTGCIATAMAQVMYYWRYPDRLPAIRGYNYKIFELEDLPSVTVDWDNILDQYQGPYTEEQAEAIATLMRYCGQGCHMMYGVDGSGSYMTSQRGALMDFGYNRSIGSFDRDRYSAEAWTAKMCDELRAGRPILYTAQANGGGHAFVIDGWHDGMFHINWGWAGTGNGYFVLDAFNVEGYRFNRDQAMLTNVRPANGNGGNESVIELDFVEDNICYKIDGNGVKVTGIISGFGSDIGELVIPDHVTADGRVLEVTAIGDHAFMNHIGLTGVTIPSTVKTIGRQAFRNCSALQRVELPYGVTTVGEQAFAHCVSLEHISVPATVTSIDFDAFEGCVGMQSVAIGDVAAWCAVNFANSESNPLFLGRHLLLNGEEVSTLVIPSSVTAVSRAAFINCTSLRHLVVEEGVQSLDWAAFSMCDNLTDISLPNTLVNLGRTAFGECTSLPQVVLPQGLQTIGRSAFYGCTALEHVTIPQTVTTVGAGAFEGCEALKAVNITDLEAWCRIRFADGPANPLMLAGHLSLNGETMDHFVVPEGIDMIRDNTFAGDMDLKRVDISSGVTHIGDGAFMRCRNLETLTLSKGLQHIGSNAFKGCTSLTAVTIPDEVAVLGNGAFNNCSAMKSIVFGESVTTIGKDMCDGCKSLESVVLGSHVESIGITAFYSCRLLTSVICKALTPPQVAGKASFSNETYKSALLQVPVGSEDDYAHADCWQYFTDIEGVDFDHHLPGDVNADGSVNIADVNALIAAILKGSADSMVGDINGDGAVNIADVNAIINMILQ